MTPEILAMLGMTVTVLLAVWTGNRSLRQEINDVRRELRDDRRELRDELTAIRAEIADVRKQIGALDSRIASAEGLVEGLRTAIARNAA